MLILPPLGSWAIIAPVFIDGCDFAVHYPDKGCSVAGHTSILAVHMGGSNDMGIGGNDLLHFAVPFAGVLAVRPGKFLHSKMLVGVMPVHPGIWVEIFTDGVCILPQNSIPKGFYIYTLFPLKSFAQMQFAIFGITQPCIRNLGTIVFSASKQFEFM